MAKRRGPASKGPDVLILGAAGQVGQELIRAMPEEVRLPRAKEMLDVTDHAAVQNVIESVRPQVVVNLASTNPVTTSDPSHHWAVNAFAVDNLVKTCALNGASLIHFSSSDIFGACPSFDPRVELDPICPVGAFAASKAAGEHSILALGQYPAPEFVNFRYWIIRCSLLLGRPQQARLSQRNWFSVKLEQVLGSRTPIKLPRDAFRSVVYVPHLVPHILWLIDNYLDVPTGIYHIAGGGRPSLYDLVNEARLQIDTRSQVPLLPVGLEGFLSGLGGSVTTDEFGRNGLLDNTRWSDACPLQLPDWRVAVDDFCKDYNNAR